MDQPGQVANSARGQLNITLSAFAPEKIGTANKKASTFLQYLVSNRQPTQFELVCSTFTCTAAVTTTAKYKACLFCARDNSITAVHSSSTQSIVASTPARETAMATDSSASSSSI